MMPPIPSTLTNNFYYFEGQSQPDVHIVNQNIGILRLFEFN